MLATRGNKLTWLGHSTFRITTPSSKVILIDPWVAGNPACPDEHKKFERIDTMLITHGHFDHIGDAVELARRHKPDVVAIWETCHWLESKGVQKTHGMNKGGTQRVGEIDVTMTHAMHSCGILDDGKIIYGGEACGYVINLPGGFRVYHAGDTTVFGDMKIISDLYKPELACLPIGDLYTMSPREAALAIRLLSVKHIVPMHFATFPPLTGTPEAVRNLTQDCAGLEIHALKPGETLG
ncbi:MAG TPA: metal-dependent hydrolase [Candidatus Acidoferrales bacterium]